MFKEFLKNIIYNLKIKYNRVYYKTLLQVRPLAKKFKVKIETKCLVLTPYPGAEIIGLGGLIAQYPKNFEVLCLTFGAQRNKTNENKELFEQIMKDARVKGYKIFDIAQGELKNEYKKFSKIDISELDYIFIPAPFLYNEDKMALIEHFKNLLKEKEHKKTLQILFYENDCTITYTDYFCDISNILTLKKQMLQTCFKDKEDLVSGVLGLNKFRGQALNVDFAEVFSAFYVKDFLELKFYDQ